MEGNHCRTIRNLGVKSRPEGTFQNTTVNIVTSSVKNEEKRHSSSSKSSKEMPDSRSESETEKTSVRRTSYISPTVEHEAQRGGQGFVSLFLWEKQTPQKQGIPGYQPGEWSLLESVKLSDIPFSRYNIQLRGLGRTKLLKKRQPSTGPNEVANAQLMQPYIYYQVSPSL